MPTENDVAITVFEAYYRDVVSDDYRNYGPGTSDADYAGNEFYLHHNESGKRFKITVEEVTP